MSFNINRCVIYSVKKYKDADKGFINDKKIKFNSFEELIEELNVDNFYHFRIHKNQNYIFFGDLDNYKKDIFTFKSILINFLNKYYRIEIKENEIKYTQNNEKINSYHYSIPKIYCSSEKLKEIHSNLIKINKEEFIYKGEKKLEKVVDTTIYSEHWFRCPNQSKGTGIYNNKHIIKEGDMIDFIVYYIPEYSLNIENNMFIGEIKELPIIHKKDKQELALIDKEKNVLSYTISQPLIYKRMFDECYSQERFEIYEYWITVGMAIKNTFQNEEDAFDLFNYFSSKGRNYEGIEKTKCKYAALIKKNNSTGYTSATIYFYEIQDNKPKFIEIMSKNTLELGQTDICKYLKNIGGHNFIYKRYGDVLKLYCFNGNYWENNNIVFRQYLSNELYEFLKRILFEVYWNNKEFNNLKTKIERLKSISFKKEIEETYKEYGINETIQFDKKWWLYGFNNKVYDLNIGCFREYRYDDYVSITTGFDWREPTQEELSTMNNLIKSIMPIEEERKLFLQILSTTLEGRCLEKFVVFNGEGGNGKGVINDILLKALGNYGMIGNNAILFEKNKTGSNPEKANIHKKRLVIFREPPEKNKFENSVVKELTGGGNFSARGHHENTTEKELNLTMLVECNKRPTFSEEPQNAEIRRTIDIYFRSTFTTDKKIINQDKYIYLSNLEFKTQDFQEKHKFALIKILLETYEEYKMNDYVLDIPESIKERTNLYLEMSCNILQWFKDNYIYSKNKDDILKIKDIFDDFKINDYYQNLTKNERKIYNKSYFINYFKTNSFLKNFYIERTSTNRNFLQEWIKKEDDE